VIPFDQREFLTELTGGLWAFRLGKVFQADGWDFATNGHALLRLRGASPRFRPSEAEDASAPPPPLDHLVGAARPNKRAASMASLCEWAEMAGVYRRHCPYCESPQDTPNVINSTLGDVEINRCLLWHYLKCLPREGTVEISWGAPLDALLITHADWELFLMPFDTTPAAANKPFEFDEAVSK